MRILDWLCFNMLLGASLRLIMTVGEVNFAHAGFMGIGAYTSALLVMNANLSFWLALPAAGIMAAFVALAFGSVTLKLKGAYFFMASFAFGEVIRIIFHNTFIDLFGGSLGLLGIPEPPAFFGIPFGPTRSVAFFYLVFIITAISLFILYRLESSPYGRLFQGIREADNLAESVGIHIMKYKILAFAVGCFFAGIVGSLYAHLNVVIAPPDFTYHLSIFIVAYVVVGGSDKFVGPILGALTLTLITEFLRKYTYFEIILFGLAIIAVMIFAPKGLSGIFERIFRAFRVQGNNRS
jgi:branched-chain amino acid transport system permease protein